MAALNPTKQSSPEDFFTSPGAMDNATRDRFILKTIARVERIDTEMEDLVAEVKENTTKRGEQAVELAEIRRQLTAMAETLRTILKTVQQMKT